MFHPDEPRDKAGRWTHFPVIRMSDLSTPDARRSPEVSEAEFQKYAARGEQKFNKLKGTPKPANALKNGANWNKVIEDAYKATRSEWGGVTVDSHTGKHVDPDADLYALTVREPGQESVHISPSANLADFTKGMDEARRRFGTQLRRPGYHLGVFHDADTGNIDIDPVLVTSRLEDVHDIGAYTHAVGGAYHFKSGDGFWPPHVKENTVKKAKKKAKADLSLSLLTPVLHNADLDLATEGGKIAFWKQILPMKTIQYTAKDGSRQTIDFSKEYLSALASNKAVDKIGFLLADKDNAHTMDPERWRGEVAAMEVREDGLYGKIVFPTPEAAKAVMDNPDLGVSARIRPNVQRSDGSTVPAGIIHVLGTLDPQVSGMSPWQPADLSTDQGEVLDLSDKEYDDMADKAKDISDYTETDIEKMTDAELDAFLAEFVPDFDSYTGDAPSEEEDVDKADEHEDEPEKVGADMSKDSGKDDIELANAAVARAEARAAEALKRVADAEWRAERDSLLSAGVPPHALDLAAPVLNRADDMVIDLSNSDEDDVNVSEVVRGLLDTLKGTVDLSAEMGHVGTFSSKDGEDPDKAMLDAWDAQS